MLREVFIEGPPNSGRTTAAVAIANGLAAENVPTAFVTPDADQARIRKDCDVMLSEVLTARQAMGAAGGRCRTFVVDGAGKMPAGLRAALIGHAARHAFAVIYWVVDLGEGADLRHRWARENDAGAVAEALA